MQYLKPTTGIVFKKLFGDQKRTDLTVSFLNAVLQRSEGNLITRITINEDANLPELVDQKYSFVDVRCTDQEGKQYIVEMQVVRQKHFLQRAQYYSAIGLYMQLKSKQKYHDLAPVIFVGVLDFDVFEQPNYMTHHLITDAQTGKQSLHHLEYHFLELPKFNKTIEQVRTPTEKWAWFIKTADEMGEIPQQMQSDEAFIEAFHVLERSAWSATEFRAYEKSLDDERSEYDKLATAGEEGEQRAIRKGLKEGVCKVARAMLAQGLSIEAIVQFTELTPEEIQKLR